MDKGGAGFSKTTQRLKRAIRSPALVARFCRERISGLSYYWLDGSYAGYPTEIKLYVNSTCNAKCQMCDVGVNERESVFYRQLVPVRDIRLTMESCEKLVKAVRRFKPWMNISGVEPLLHPDIIGILNLFRSNGLHYSLSTNGILLTGLAEEIVRQNPDRITVSLDGLEEIHNKVRGVEIYRNVLTGIQTLIYHKKLHRSKMEIGVNFCVTPVNHHQLVDFAAHLIRQEGIEHILFIHPYFITDQAAEEQKQLFPDMGYATAANYKMDFSLMDIKVLWDQIQRLKQGEYRCRVSFNVDFSSVDKLRAYYFQPKELIAKDKCLIPWKKATVLSNGDVVIHNRCLYYMTGNIHSEPFAAIWNGQQYRLFRRELKKWRRFPVCSRCCGLMM